MEEGSVIKKVTDKKDCSACHKTDVDDDISDQAQYERQNNEQCESCAVQLVSSECIENGGE